MKILLIFIWIYGAMIATAFWEAYVEGRNAWDRGKLGWKLKIGKYTVLTAYHFSIFGVMWPLLLTLPFIIFYWDTKMFGVVLSAFFSGTVIEDFTWYLVNPVVKVSELSTDFANYYPRVSIGKYKIPLNYFIGIGLALLSWLFFWK